VVLLRNASGRFIKPKYVRLILHLTRASFDEVLSSVKNNFTGVRSRRRHQRGRKSREKYRERRKAAKGKKVPLADYASEGSWDEEIPWLRSADASRGLPKRSLSPDPGSTESSLTGETPVARTRPTVKPVESNPYLANMPKPVDAGSSDSRRLLSTDNVREHTLKDLKVLSDQVGGPWAPRIKDSSGNWIPHVEHPHCHCIYCDITDLSIDELDDGRNGLWSVDPRIARGQIYFDRETKLPDGSRRFTPRAKTAPSVAAWVAAGKPTTYAKWKAENLS
jgi:hypothetical protein